MTVVRRLRGRAGIIAALTVPTLAAVLAGWAARPATATSTLAAATQGHARAAVAGVAQPVPDAATVDVVRLYRTHCAACHGDDGLGVEGRGPSLQPEGRASADFVLRTGRMPLADVDRQPQRKPSPFSEAEIVALVDYVGLLGDGPDIPDVDPARGSLAAGAELYRLNCAACHVASGAGAVIGSGRTAPPLTDATPTQVGEAVLIGPGAMPVFGGLSQGDIDAIAAYIEALQEEGTTNPDALGGVGPVAEGLAAWLLGVLPLVAVTRWIGAPREDNTAGAADPLPEEGAR